MVQNLLRISFLILIAIQYSCKDVPEFQRQPVVKQDKATDTTQINNKDIDSDERSDWQKPHLIINELGDLNGKTIADIGAGALGYFVFKILGQTQAEKVIALDIDKEAVAMLSQLKSALSENQKSRLEVRLALPNDPKLLDNEIDVALFVNTVSYINNRVSYFRNLKNKLKENGQIVIVDFKTKRIPAYVNAPKYNNRVYLDILEEELYAAGYSQVITDDVSLKYQYKITAKK